MRATIKPSSSLVGLLVLSSFWACLGLPSAHAKPLTIVCSWKSGEAGGEQTFDIDFDNDRVYVSVSGETVAAQITSAYIQFYPQNTSAVRIDRNTGDQYYYPSHPVGGVTGVGPVFWYATGRTCEPASQ